MGAGVGAVPWFWFPPSFLLYILFFVAAGGTPQKSEGKPGKSQGKARENLVETRGKPRESLGKTLGETRGKPGQIWENQAEREGNPRRKLGGDQGKPMEKAREDSLVKPRENVCRTMGPKSVCANLLVKTLVQTRHRNCHLWSTYLGSYLLPDCCVQAYNV